MRGLTPSAARPLFAGARHLPLRWRQGEKGKPRHLLPQSCCRCSIGQQDSVSRSRACARSGNGTLHVPFPSSKAVKATPRRSKAFGSAARFVCRMTLYACHSSSHKTRYAIFVGTLKDKKALSRPQTHPKKRRSIFLGTPRREARERRVPYLK